jgi:predicted branched-subunit amino acid permease
MPSPDSSVTTRAILLRALPAAIAIGVFGALYGAAARPLIGPEMTIGGSLVIFSGALQFAIVGLLTAGAAAPALLLTTVTLNLRHVVLGAVLRPRMSDSRLRRAGLAWFLLDETFGFAATAATDPRLSATERAAITERTLLVSGVLCYAAWMVGTVLGVLGAGLPGLEGFASAVFPVLFIGLAALTTRSRSIAVRAVAAAAITAVIAVTWPDARALAPVVAGILVALPPGGQRPATPTPAPVPAPETAIRSDPA